VSRGQLEVRGLTKTFLPRSSKGIMNRRAAAAVTAVDGVDLSVEGGSIVGLVGESGCGKSTLARCIAGVYPATAGEIRLDGGVLPTKRPRNDLRRVQMIFQDPQSALNPRVTVRQTLTELLHAHHLVPSDDVDDRCRELLRLVGLGDGLLDAYPRRLSGGQRQRVSTARALALNPDVLIADEPTSALDVSVQAAILGLFLRLNRDLGLTILFISHDMAVVRQVSAQVAVMYLGRIVEFGSAEAVFRHPAHPYTKVLLSAIPRLAPGRTSTAIALAGDPPSPTNLPTGCRFHPRCSLAQDRCRTDDPMLHSGPDQAHTAACHFAWGVGADRNQSD
jgi:oligopeptide/dipeptide ABC transporter ATP-binding protein